MKGQCATMVRPDREPRPSISTILAIIKLVLWLIWVILTRDDG